MECLEFRRQADADRQHLGSEALQHAAACRRCAGYLVAPRRGGDAIVVLERRRWTALAASIIGGVLIGTLLWVGGPRNSLTHDLLKHLDHEPEALVATKRLEEEAVLGRVLARGGIRLRPDAPLVSYASSCHFRGHTVPHLVVQTTDGPVTVMVLRNEGPASPASFVARGHAGRIVPAGPGSIAVVGADGVDLDEIAARVLAAVEWLDD